MSEKKAYDLKELAALLKAKGLIVAEEAAGEVYTTVMDWVCESATISVNPFDDVIKLARPYIDSLVLPLIDKIDGQVGN